MDQKGGTYPLSAWMIPSKIAIVFFSRRKLPSLRKQIHSVQGELFKKTTSLSLAMAVAFLFYNL